MECLRAQHEEFGGILSKDALYIRPLFKDSKIPACAGLPPRKRGNDDDVGRGNDDDVGRGNDGQAGGLGGNDGQAGGLGGNDGQGGSDVGV